MLRGGGAISYTSSLLPTIRSIGRSVPTYLILVGATALLVTLRV